MPYLSDNIFLTEDKMMWMILDSNLESLTDFLWTNQFALFAVDFDQNVESMIETEEELKEAFNNNIPICIEVIKFDYIYYKLPKTN